MELPRDGTAEGTGGAAPVGWVGVGVSEGIGGEEFRSDGGAGDIAGGGLDGTSKGTTGEEGTRGAPPVGVAARAVADDVGGTGGADRVRGGVAAVGDLVGECAFVDMAVEGGGLVNDR